MKTSKLLKFYSALFAAVLPSHGQGTFQNLNFESSTLGPTGGQFREPVPIATALPGWSASIDNVPQTQVMQNYFTGGEASINIEGPNWDTIDPGIIDGSYTVFLQAFNPAQGDVSLSQNGMIPANAESLQFRAWNRYPTADFSVSFAGNSLSPVVLSSGQTQAGQPYNVYGVNIASYAGQTGQLEFTPCPVPVPLGPNWMTSLFLPLRSRRSQARWRSLSWAG